MIFICGVVFFRSLGEKRKKKKGRKKGHPFVP